MYKIIFDTNFLKNDGFETFLGNAKNIKEFKKHCEILIPDIVIDEIKQQKVENFNKKKSELEQNPVYKKFISKNNALSKINIDEHIKVLQDKDNISYKVIYLSKPDGILEKIKDLALKNLPPFKEKKDEGFKDSYIYFTILEYIEDQKDKIFVATKDGKLQEALEKHKNIVIVQNYKDFESNIIEQYKDDYFIDKLKESLINEAIVADDIIELWKNSSGNDILVVKTDSSRNILEIDSREIINTATYSEYKKYIQMLIYSNSFAETHSAIKKIQDYIQYFSNNDVEKIFNASVNNDQIRYIADDEDVKEFLLSLYKSNENLADEEFKNLIEQLKNETK